MRIEVAGIPAPQGSKRHVGGGRMVESSRAVGPWREAVRAEAQRVIEERHDWRLPGQASLVEMHFYLPRPRGHYGTGRNSHLLKPSAPRRPVTRPDVDKLMRSTLDGLVSGGVLDDDSDVVTVVASKLYADGRRAGCLIYIVDPDLEEGEEDE